MAFTYQKTGADLTKRKALGESNKLFNSMGEKEYESSLKAIITMTLRKTPQATERNTAVPDKDISFNLAHIPSKNIGASKEDDGRREYNNTAINGFIVPVSTLKVAREQSDLTQDWFENTIKEAIPTIELGKESWSWERYSNLRNSVTNHNQDAAREVNGQLDQRNITGQVRKKLRARLMAEKRKVLSTYSVDVNITIIHNIYDSYFVKNFKDNKDIVDYFSSRTKLYSRNVTKRMSIPVSSMDELEKVFKAIKNLEFDYNKLQVVDKQKVVELSQEPAKEEYIISDDQLAAELGFEDNSETLDNESFDNLDELFSLFHQSGDMNPLENKNAENPDSLS